MELVTILLSVVVEEKDGVWVEIVLSKVLIGEEVNVDSLSPEVEVSVEPFVNDVVVMFTRSTNGGAEVVKLLVEDVVVDSFTEDVMLFFGEEVVIDSSPCESLEDVEGDTEGNSTQPSGVVIGLQSE